MIYNLLLCSDIQYYSTLLHDGDQLKWLVHCFGVRVLSVMLLCGKKRVLCAMCTNHAYKK